MVHLQSNMNPRCREQWVSLSCKSLLVNGLICTNIEVVMFAPLIISLMRRYCVNSPVCLDAILFWKALICAFQTEFLVPQEHAHLSNTKICLCILLYLSLRMVLAFYTGMLSWQQIVFQHNSCLTMIGVYNIWYSKFCSWGNVISLTDCLIHTRQRCWIHSRISTFTQL